MATNDPNPREIPITDAETHDLDMDREMRGTGEDDPAGPDQKAEGADFLNRNTDEPLEDDDTE